MFKTEERKTAARSALEALTAGNIACCIHIVPSFNESFNITSVCKKSVNLQETSALATDTVLQQDSIRMRS